jgi:hypothetical protein
MYVCACVCMRALALEPRIYECMYVYVFFRAYIHVCTHTYMYVNIHPHNIADFLTYIHTQLHTYIHEKCVLPRSDTYMNAYTYIQS